MYLCEECRKKMYAYQYNGMLQHFKVCDSCNNVKICHDIQPLSKRDVKVLPAEEIIKEE